MKKLALVLVLASLPALAVSVRGGVKDETTLKGLSVGSIELSGSEAEAELYALCHPPFPPAPGPAPIVPPVPPSEVRHDCGKKVTLVFDLVKEEDREQYALLLHSHRVDVTLKDGEITSIRSRRCPAGGCYPAVTAVPALR